MIVIKYVRWLAKLHFAKSEKAMWYTCSLSPKLGFFRWLFTAKNERIWWNDILNNFLIKLDDSWLILLEALELLSLSSLVLFVYVWQFNVVNLLIWMFIQINCATEQNLWYLFSVFHLQKLQGRMQEIKKSIIASCNCKNILERIFCDDVTMSSGWCYHTIDSTNFIRWIITIFQVSTTCKSKFEDSLIKHNFNG